jgi:hypothetical protein
MIVEIQEWLKKIWKNAVFIIFAIAEFHAFFKILGWNVEAYLHHAFDVETSF